ncbi:MAG: MFS transporter [Acidobacteria bacterium]|nr:MFS transporter [Acidobacteriota bacterium]
MSWLRRVPRIVIMLGVVSLLTDLSSEMIYPLLPIFLTAVLAAGPEALGVIEGTAEATAALLKLVSGAWSDRVRRRKPLVVGGYSLASVARPLIGLAGSWPVVLALRFADRLGKGLRTSPRDALIADATPADQRGAAYGVHRAMDHAGAVLGPLVAAALLKLGGLQIRHIFLLAAVPGAAVVIVLLSAVHEKRPTAPLRTRPAGSVRATARELRPLLAALAVFTLGNSTDAFLLLRLADIGVTAASVAVLWSALHVVKLTVNTLAGRVSDLAGRRPLMLAGWGVYAAVYATFAIAHGRVVFIVAFLIYGAFFGLTEPVEKAWIADLVPAASRGTAFGLYHATIGLVALPASVLFGVLWKLLGAPAAFTTGAGLAVLAALLLLRAPTGNPRSGPERLPA